MFRESSNTVKTSLNDSHPSVFEQDGREVLACIHCRLVQFRTSNSMCRRCRKPLGDNSEKCTEVEPAATESELTPIAGLSEAVRSLGPRVCELRKKQGLTQRELARRMRVPRTYISKVETSRTAPSVPTLYRIAAGLEVEIVDLLCDQSSRRQEETARILGDPFLAEIAQLTNRLSPVHRALILRTVRDAAGIHPLPA